MNVLSLYTGIGGFDLGLERAGMRIAGQCEIDSFCIAVLEKHWPKVWRHHDIRTLTGELVREHCGRIGLVCGGFPCQDISNAGKGAGIDGSRSGLWREMLRLVREVRPDWVIVENVSALRKRGADRVLGDLGKADYACRVFVVGAEAVGAPHKRERVWIVANSDGLRLPQCEGDITEIGRRFGDSSGEEVAHTSSPRCERRQECGASAGDASQNGGGCAKSERGGIKLADAASERRERRKPTRRAGGGREGSCAGEHGHSWPSGPGKIQHAWEAPRLVKFPLGGELNGVPVRLVRFANRNTIKAYGNALLPQIPEILGRVILGIKPPPKPAP